MHFERKCLILCVLAVKCDLSVYTFVFSTFSPFLTISPNLINLTKSHLFFQSHQSNQISQNFTFSCLTKSHQSHKFLLISPIVANLTFLTISPISPISPYLAPFLTFSHTFLLISPNFTNFTNLTDHAL